MRLATGQLPAHLFPVLAVFLFFLTLLPPNSNNVARATKQWTIDNGKWIVPRVYRTIVRYPLSTINWIVARATFLLGLSGVIFRLASFAVIAVFRKCKI